MLISHLDLNPDPNNLPELDPKDAFLVSDLPVSFPNAASQAASSSNGPSMNVSWLRKTEYISSSSSANIPTTREMWVFTIASCVHDPLKLMLIYTVDVPPKSLSLMSLMALRSRPSRHHSEILSQSSNGPSFDIPPNLTYVLLIHTRSSLMREYGRMRMILLNSLRDQETVPQRFVSTSSPITFMLTAFY